MIVWGENSQDEYGGPAAASQNNELNRRWLEEFGGLLGMRVSDLLGQEGIEHRHLVQYFYPTDEELKDVGVTGLFLGYYMPWDGYRNALVAQAYGFHSYHKANEGALVNYENLDNCHSGIHDYLNSLIRFWTCDGPGLPAYPTWPSDACGGCLFGGEAGWQIPMDASGLSPGHTTG